MTSSNGYKQVFRQFDVVSDMSDHHFVGKPYKATSSGSYKKIMQEWKILQKDLPESIFVRVYEARTDLLRAAIVGARGTPYHDGLFFFDIQFPCDYPNQPPLVHYRSFGYRINPNLYDDGHVCLSLLNTWIGKTNERWNSKQSTILQVLVSIQALVLNEKPFFNEPGSGSGLFSRMGKLMSNGYNEDVFILNCKTMIHLISCPPKNFGPLVKFHFKNRAQFILNAFDGYKKGLFRVGYFYSGMDQKVKVSSLFKNQADQLYGKLLNAMMSVDASLEQFVQQEIEKKKAKEREEAENEREKKKKAKEKKEAKKRESSEFRKRIVKEFKKILFLECFTNKTNTNPITTLSNVH